MIDKRPSVIARCATTDVHPISAWDDPADDERVIAANRAFADAMRLFSTGGAYLNFTTDGDRVEDGYGNASTPGSSFEGEVRPDEPLPRQPEHRIAVHGTARAHLSVC